MKRRRQFQSRGALEWIEEATHLLRTSPLAVLATYYIGALPFVLGLLFFWADMSRSPFAKQHVVEAALGLSLLFLWMKTWQAIFCLRLRAVVAGEAIEPLNFRHCLRVFIAQATIQPAGLLLIPFALLIALPFAWVFGFYQNATAIAEPGAAEGQSLFKRAARSMRFWPGQYHVILLVLGAFAGFVFLNWTIVCVALPGLLKMLLGIETAFSRSPMAMLNTTFFATMAGLTYLCVDPVVKALHVLRSFRGEAQTTGEDLKAELRQVVITGRQVAAVVVVSVFVFGSGGEVLGATDSPSPLNHNLTLNLNPFVPSVQGQEIKSKITIKIKSREDGGALKNTGTPESSESPALAPPPTATPIAQPASMPSQQLDKTIEDVISQQKYTWRMPREKVAKKEASEDGFIAKFLKDTGEMLRKWAQSIGDWLDKMFSRKSRPTNPTPNLPSGIFSGLGAGLQMLLYVLIALAVVALLYLAYRVWQNRRRGPEIVEATAIQPVPDLADENVGADQLPEDEWTRLARELLARSEFRLAMRAYYLSSLACLAERRLITLAKFKSNRDYERELARRGHALADLPGLFAQNVVVFDRVWYGQHSVDGEIVGRFAGNVEKLRATA